MADGLALWPPKLGFSRNNSGMIFGFMLLWYEYIIFYFASVLV